ncbi:MAG: hypothetical protein WAT39_04120 [Planctomycetota bacterium]
MGTSKPLWAGFALAAGIVALAAFLVLRDRGATAHGSKEATGRAEPRPQDGGFHPQVLLTNEHTSFHDLSHHQFEQPVSVAVLDAEHVAICNYSQLAILNWKTGVFTRTAPPVAKWVPTGLTFHLPTRRLLVANYKGGNVVVLRLGQDNSLQYLSELRAPGMKGPEGVAIADDGTRIGVADYDAGTGFVFDAEGRLVGAQSIGGAHGVAFHESSRTFLVTGLAPPGVFEIGSNGETITQFGTIGWGASEFLWPTSISISPQHVVAVSDAHTGEISLHEATGLRETTSLGGNGPDTGRFNMPYGCAWLDDDLLWVADTFRSRLVLVQISTCVVRQSWILGGMNRVPEPVAKRLSMELGTSEFAVTGGACTVPDAEIRARGLWRLRTDHSRVLELRLVPSGPSVAWHPAYAGFVTDDRTLAFRWVPLLSSGYYYFMQADQLRHRDWEMVFVGSPQNNHVLVSWDGLVTSIQIAFGLWLRGSALCNGEVTVPLSLIASLAARRFERFQDAVRAAVPRDKAIADCLFPESPAAALSANLDKVFEDRPTRELVEATMHGSAEARERLDAYRRELIGAQVIDAPQMFLLNAILY